MTIDTKLRKPLPRSDVRARKRGLAKRTVEFTMIVVGVLVALAANAWWEERQDAQLAGDYGERLAAELRVNLATADEVLRHTTRIQAATDSLQSFFEDGNVSMAADRILANLYNATRRWTAGFSSSTFDDLTSTGNLRLIRDPELRSQLGVLYGQLRRYTADWYGSEFRLAARKAIPIAFQFQVRAECGAIGGEDWKGCAVGGDKEWAETTARRIREDNDLRGAYRVQAHEIAIFSRDLARHRAQIDALLKSFENKISRRRGR